MIDNHKRVILPIVLVGTIILYGCGPNGEQLLQQAQSEDDKSVRKAELLFKAADKGSLEAMVLAGNLLMTGEGIEPNKEKGFVLIRKAAEAGYPDGMYYLSLCYEEGKGIEIDMDKARYWGELAIQNESHMAMFMDARQTYNDIRQSSVNRSIRALEGDSGIYGREDSFSTFEKEKIKSAILVFKHIVEGDWEMTEECVREACCSLGAIYEGGLGVPKNTKTAIRYYERAKENGDHWAAFKIGCMYCEGIDGSKNYDKGVPLLQDWLKTNGDSFYALQLRALQLIGLAYLDANWSSFDIGKAKAMFEDALDVQAASDDTDSASVEDALYGLGRILLFEDEKNRDESLGISYLEQAAEGLSADACLYLGRAYAEGVGVEQDMTLAHKYFLRAKNLRELREQTH